MFDTLDYQLVLTSFTFCLFTYFKIEHINIKHLSFFFHSLPILTDFLKFEPLLPRLLNLTKISDPSPHSRLF